MFECGFCDKKFLHNWLLNNHQTNSKFCSLKKEINDCQNEKITYQKEIQQLSIKLQIQQIIDDEFKVKFTAQKNQLKKYKKLIKTLQVQVREQKKEIDKHQNNLVKLASKPQTQINQYNQINICLSSFNEIELLDKYEHALNVANITDFVDGQKSISQLLAPCLQNDDKTLMMMTQDDNNLMYRNTKGHIVEDVDSKKLRELIYPTTKEIVYLFLDEEEEKIEKKMKPINKLQNHINQLTEEIDVLSNKKTHEKILLTKMHIIKTIKEKENEIIVLKDELTKRQNELKRVLHKEKIEEIRCEIDKLNTDGKPFHDNLTTILKPYEAQFKEHFETLKNKKKKIKNFV